MAGASAFRMNQVSLLIGDWDSVREHAQAVREEVFVIEQGVPIELEWDESDEVSLHAVAYDADGLAIATGRLLPDGHVGRMAVRQSARGSGIGSKVMQALIGEAQRLGYTELLLHAQIQAAGFYAKHQFTAFGEQFMEAGIPHCFMRRVL